MKPKGALQPEIPPPITIPQNWHISIIDSQDCLFNIPLHPLDRGRLTFSVPYPNHIGPHKRFQQTMLPQGMLKSPATAAVKSLQSCPTLCDPIDVSPPGSPIPGILQTRVLKQGAIAFSITVLVFVKILQPRLYFLCDSNSLMHISLIIYYSYKKEK